MNDERWKTLLSLTQFILGTVVVGIFGTIINSQIQERELDIKEQEQIAKNLSTMLSQNAGDKLLMAQFYAAVTRSDVIQKRWEIYRNELKDEIKNALAQREKLAAELQQATEAKALDQKQAVIQEIEAQIIPGTKPVPPESLPARMYFHLHNAGQRAKTAAVATRLAQQSEVIVPSLQLVDATSNASELRYFKPADAVQAARFGNSLRQQGIATQVEYISGYESSQRLRLKHYELWLSANWGHSDER